METMMAPQSMAPAPFIYYSPDANPEDLQHGHFTSHPAFQHMSMYPAVPTLPSTPIYSRPNSSCSRQQMSQSKAFNAGLAAAMTQGASPRPLTQKPAIMLETELCEADGLFYPSTPPLSTSGSVISSPGSCDLLQTPLNPMFSGLDGLEGKDVCQVDGQVENFPNVDWTSCTSPPMTPGGFPRLSFSLAPCF
jgi:hypothetical protein